MRVVAATAARRRRRRPTTSTASPRPTPRRSTLTAGQTRTDVDFGYRGTASIGDRVWNDADGDGVQDAGEAGINGVTVELLDSGGNVIATTTTSGNGNYTFSNLAAGTYTVRVVSSTLPAGPRRPSTSTASATAHTAAVTLTAGPEPHRRRLRLPRHRLAR